MPEAIIDREYRELPYPAKDVYCLSMAISHGREGAKNGKNRIP